ncbi:MAG: hypothetical protein NT069_33495, partial [Planctomycetota bacterium]|nr:hypothetical protein [Planctomycetota bacterium]
GVPAGFTGAVTESAGNIVLQAGKADGQADSYQVGVAHTASGDKLEIQVNGEKVFETKADAFKSLKVVGNEDAESLTVDLFHGTGSLTGVVGFEGGVGHGDSLTLAAGSANSIATEWSEQGGRIAVSGPSQSFTIQFGGSVDRVDDRLAATSRSFSSDVVGQTVSLNSMETPATGRIGLSDGRQFNFQTPSSQLRIDLQGASDQLHVENWQSGGNVDLKLDSKSLAIQGRMELGTGDLAIHAHRTDIAGEIVGNGDSVAVFGGDDSLVTVSGRIELTSVGESGSGGRVDLFATRVSIQDGALIDVSGAGSGGTIRVGGDLHGTPGDFTTADRVWIASDAVLRADGTGAIGAGGTVVIWSRELTGFSGTISAVGVGGAGGFAEVSSEATVLYRGSADLRGSQGT